MRLAVALLTALVIPALATAEDKVLQTFNKTQLHDQFWSEGANFGDLNRDGHNDIVAGPYWWEGPKFEKRHEYYPATMTFELKLGPMTSVRVPGFHGTLGTQNHYSDNFFAWVYDFNGDQWNDILIIGFPGQDASWFENPKGGDGHWTRHKVFDTVDNESPTWVDITGDGKPEIVCNAQERLGYVAPDWKDPAAPWKFHKISPKGGWQRFTHGLGVGDVNGDNKPDLLEAGGWWEQPASLEGDPDWIQHKVKFADYGGAQMYAYDFNNDGKNDVITSLQAHGFGLVWHEQTRDGDKIDFKPHLIIGESPAENRYGVKFSEMHAIDLVDMDGDGVKDIVTGKRFWSHGREGDPDRNAAAVLYWFKTVRSAEKGPATVDFIPYQIDDASGVGTQVVAGDINGDGAPDIVVGNKRGVFVHLQERKKVSAEEWQKAQPKPVAAK